jgi:hypothetical protein
VLSTLSVAIITSSCKSSLGSGCVSWPLYAITSTRGVRS